MAINNKQKIVIVPIDANTKAFIEARLLEGYVIEHIITLLPKYESLLIIYATPETI